MKLSKASSYLLSFVGLCVMFTACYYLSYRRALYEINKNAVERKEQLLVLDKDIQPTPMQLADDSQVEPVDVLPDLTIKPTTEYILQVYNMKTDTTETNTLHPPGYLVGLTKDGVQDYLDNYMNDLTLSEYNKGLISFELLSFAEDRVVLKKTYNEDFVPFRFYVVVKDGYVVVYNSDLKSVFSYTSIEAKELPEEDRIALSQGIYVNSEEELYALLESFSS